MNSPIVWRAELRLIPALTWISKSTLCSCNPLMSFGNRSLMPCDLRLSLKIAHHRLRLSVPAISSRDDCELGALRFLRVVQTFYSSSYLSEISFELIVHRHSAFIFVGFSEDAMDASGVVP